MNIADIVVYDGASTPVLHTLKAVSVERVNGKSGKIEAVWREQIASLPTYAQVTARLTLTRTARSGVWHTDFRIEVPVMESISGQNSSGYTAAPKVAYTDTVGLYGHFHERGTIAGRRLAKQLILNIGNNVATSVSAAMTGVLDELMSQLVAPT